MICSCGSSSSSVYYPLGLLAIVLSELQMDVPVAANVLGVAGAVCWSVQVGFEAQGSNSLSLAAQAHPADNHQLPTA